MKRIGLIIILINVMFSQTSSMSLYGFGEYIDSYDASSISMGDVKLFNVSEKKIVLSSPSTHTNIDYSNLSMSIAFNRLLLGDNKLSSNNFHYFSFVFPFTDKLSLGLGMNPLFRCNAEVKELDYNYIGADQSNVDYNNDGILDPLAYKTDYNINGGISELHASLGSKIGENIKWGVKFAKLFGTSDRSYFLNMYVPQYNQEGSITNYLFLNSSSEVNEYEYSSYSYKVDIRSRLKLFDNSQVIAFSFEKANPMKIKVDADFNSIENVDELSFISNSGYEKYGFGLKMNIDDEFGFIFETHQFNSFKSPQSVNIFESNNPDIFSLNCGLYKKLSNKKRNYSTNMKIGFYNKLYDIESHEISDMGLTFGIGVEYLNYNSFDVGVKFGYRESSDLNIQNEEYYKLYLTLNSGEKWFVKNRRN